MKFLGFHATKASKGWFTDYHERVNIIQYRDEFLSDMEKLERKMRHWTGENLEIVHLPELTTGEREVVLVTHDESTFYLATLDMEYKTKKEEQITFKRSK